MGERYRELDYHREERITREDLEEILNDKKQKLVELNTLLELSDYAYGNLLIDLNDTAIENSKPILERMLDVLDQYYYVKKRYNDALKEVEELLEELGQ